MSSARVRRYWTKLAERGCLICGMPAEIAHAHGGSIVERMREPKAKGKKLERYSWLVLPLCPWHGREPYPEALDTNVKAWEAAFGPQAKWIDQLCGEYNLPLWELAGINRKEAA